MRIRIRIQQLKLMRIHADPDPRPCPPPTGYVPRVPIPHPYTQPSHPKRIEYKGATLRFGRRRLLIFEVFLGLHRKREGEEGGTGLCLWQPSYFPESWQFSVSLEQP